MALARIRTALILAVGAAALAPSASAGERTRAQLHMSADVAYSGPRGPTLDAYYRPQSAVLRPAVLVVHGGSWQFGDKRRMTRVSKQLARAGFAVFNANYTLAEESRPGFPRQLRELKAAIRWIRGHAGRLRVDPRRIGALGSSAGGHLVGLLATDSNEVLGTGARVRAAVTWSAPFALDRLRPDGALAAAARVFAGCPTRQCEDRLAAASPVARVTDRDPAMLLVNSSQELVPIGQARAMAARLEETAVPHRLTVVGGSRHGMELAGEMTDEAIAFLRRNLRRDLLEPSAR